MTKDNGFLQIRKGQAILAIVLGIASPPVSVVVAYYSNKSDVQDKINDVEKKMSAQELENEKRFAKSEDMKKIAKSLTEISGALIRLETDVTHIKNGAN